jgi:hypothetical protein
MNKPYKKLSYIEKHKKLQSNIRYYFAKNFISDDVKVINKKEFKNGSWIEYKQLEVKDTYTNKIYQYNFSCKYKLGDIIKGINKRFIHCLYVSKYKVKVLDMVA